MLFFDDDFFQFFKSYLYVWQWRSIHHFKPLCEQFKLLTSSLRRFYCVCIKNTHKVCGGKDTTFHVARTLSALRSPEQIDLDHRRTRRACRAMATFLYICLLSDLQKDILVKGHRRCSLRALGVLTLLVHQLQRGCQRAAHSPCSLALYSTSRDDHEAKGLRSRDKDVFQGT